MNTGRRGPGTCSQRSVVRWTLTAKIFLMACGLLLLATTAHAAIDEESQFVLNTLSFLIWGALVMWMCAGFTMLESGSVRTKNASVICLKNIGLYSVAGLTYYLIGYNLMYTDVGAWIGSVTFLYGPSADELALLSGDETATAAVVKQNYATMSDWFFQMVFVATAASVVSGALAERVKLWSFLVFTTILTAIVYPIVGAWTWGGGWLNQMGFQDFRRLHHRALHRWLGGTGRHHGRGTSGGQIPQQRQRQGYAALERTARHPRYPHPVVRVARLQWRLPARAGRRERCRGDEQRVGEHQLGSGGGGWWPPSLSRGLCSGALIC